MTTNKRVRSKKPAPEAPKKARKPRKAKDPMHGPFKASADQIAEAAVRKSPPGDPYPDDFFISEEEDKERVIEAYREKVCNPMTGIRAFCVECQGGYLAEIKRCGRSKEEALASGNKKWCPLWEFRMGNNPFHTRKKKGESDDD